MDPPGPYKGLCSKRYIVLIAAIGVFIFFPIINHLTQRMTYAKLKFNKKEELSIAFKPKGTLIWVRRLNIVKSY